MVVESETVFWAIAAAVFLVAVVLGLVGGFFAVTAVVRGRNRGYDPAILTTALTCAMVGAAAAPVVVAWWHGNLDRRSPTTDLSPIVGVGLCVAAMTLSAAATWVVVGRLPRRRNRRPGVRRRRHHYKAWSRVTAAVTGPATIWAWFFTEVGTTYRVALSGLIITLGLRRMERRYATQTEHLPADQHGHVLYLRPFLTENRALFHLPDDRAEFTGQGRRNYVALDEFLAHDVRSRLGPFVALGNPSEVLGGATRVYLDDDGWKPELERLADGARALVMEPGRTANLRWELDYVTSEGLQTRLFIVTPPLLRWGRAMQVTTRMMDALTGWQTITWSEFAQELRTVGLYLTGSGPGPGAVVSFDGAGSSVVVAQGLRTPTEFVDVIAARVAAV